MKVIDTRESKEKFEKMLKHFDLPHKKMDNGVYLIGPDIAIQFLGCPKHLIGLEESKS